MDGTGKPYCGSEFVRLTASPLSPTTKLRIGMLESGLPKQSPVWSGRAQYLSLLDVDVLHRDLQQMVVVARRGLVHVRLHQLWPASLTKRACHLAHDCEGVAVGA